MDRLLNYESDKEESKSDPEPVLKLDAVESAPNVNISDLQQKEKEKIEVKDDPKKLKWNHLNGRVEQEKANPAKFEEQYQMFNNTGVALDPETGVEITSKQQYAKLPEEISGKKFRKELKKKRHKFGDPRQGDYAGPWATYEGQEVEGDDKCVLSEEQKAILKKAEESRQKKVEELKEEENKPVIVKAKSVFHGTLSKEFQGGSFLTPPSGIKPSGNQCYIPKKWVHTWVGHSKPVQCIRLFPKTGHLILSGSFDSQIKLWDVNTNKKCILTYLGHTEAVRDLCFANDGKTFLSASYDKNVVLWDTETGKAIRAFTNRKIPYCVKFHPDDNKQNIFMVGSGAKKVIISLINPK